jgi:anti-anti-sigma factor
MASSLRHSPQRQEAGEPELVVHFAGRRVCLDGHTMQALCDQLFALAYEPCASLVLVDFGNVDYVCSLALDTMVILDRKLRAAGRRLTLCQLRPQVEEAFVITRLNTLLDLRPHPASDVSAANGHEVNVPAGVLVMDDNTARLCVLAARLRRQGFKVFLAGNARQAIKMYSRHQREVAVVLLDVLLPGVDGHSTLAALRRINPAVRCCFITDNPEAYPRNIMLQTGAIRVFRKPLAFEEACDTLQQLVHRGPCLRLDRWVELPQ